MSTSLSLPSSPHWQPNTPDTWPNESNDSKIHHSILPGTQLGNLNIKLKNFSDGLNAFVTATVTCPCLVSVIVIFFHLLELTLRLWRQLILRWWWPRFIIVIVLFRWHRRWPIRQRVDQGKWWKSRRSDRWGDRQISEK